MQQQRFPLENLSPIDTKRSPMTPSANGSTESNSDLLYVENLSEESNTQFVNITLKPYFTNVYNDLALRSNQLKYSTHQTIEKNTFVDYVNLPGVVSDRFFALASDNRLDERIEIEDFIRVLLNVYSSSLEVKMKVVFDIFDFN